MSQPKKQQTNSSLDSILGSAKAYDPSKPKKVGTGKTKKKKMQPRAIKEQIRELENFKQQADVVMSRQHEAIQALLATLENVAFVANRANGVSLALVKYLIDKEAATSEDVWSRVGLLEKMAQDAKNELRLDEYLSADLDDYLEDIAEMAAANASDPDEA